MELLWRFYLGITVFFNANISLACCIMHKYYLGIGLFVLTIIISLFVSHVWQNERQNKLNNIWLSDKYGKRITDLLEPGYGLDTVSIRNNGVILMSKSNYQAIDKDDLTLGLKGDYIVLKSNEIRPAKLYLYAEARKLNKIRRYFSIRN